MIPSIDRRIASLMDLKRKIESEGIHEKDKGKVITISREFGCQAYPVARQLKTKLEGLTRKTWTVFEEEEIEKTSSDSILSAHLADNFGEQSHIIDSIVSALNPNWKTEEDYYKAVIKTIVAIANRGNAILVGRGAAVVTRGMPNCFNFRLIGKEEFRARSYAQRHNVPLKEAEKIVVTKERNRREFLKHFLGTEFDLHNFHMIFNCEKNSIEKTVDTIISYVYEFQ